MRNNHKKKVGDKVEKMKWVLKFIKEYNLKYWLANSIIILGSIITKVIPVILIGDMINKGIYENDFSKIPLLFIISITMYFIGRLITYGGILLIDTVRYNLASKLKKSCYKKLNELDQSFYKEKSIGELTTILTTDVHIIHHNMCFVVKQSMGMLASSILAILYCLYISPILTLIILISTPIIAIISHKHIKNSNKVYQTERESLSNLNSYIQENIEGNRLVKTFGNEEKEIKEFKEKNRALKDRNLKIQNLNINYTTKMDFLSYLMEILLVLFGGIFVMKGQATLGDFVTINTFMGSIKKPFVQMSGFVNDWQQFKVAVARTRALLESKTDIQDEGKLKLTSWNNISFQNVSLEIDNKPVIKNINFNLQPNKTYAFIGEVGSGKSTIAKLLLRLLENTTGEIKIGNKPINDYTIESLRKNIGYVSQTPFLFSDTISNNVTFGNTELLEQDVKHFLQIAKADYVFSLPYGIHTVIGENGVSLSGGEKQRLCLARALAKQPSILILDDITSALDFETELEVTNNINNLQYQCTKIIIAQKILSVKNADEIFVMKDGKIIEHGTHEQLLNQKGMYQEIYNIQTSAEEEYA